MTNEPRTTQPRRVLAGSMRCVECRGRGEVSMGERHGFHEWSLCPVCHGNTVVPIWKDLGRPLLSAKELAASRRRQAMWDEVDWP